MEQRTDGVRTDRIAGVRNMRRTAALWALGFSLLLLVGAGRSAEVRASEDDSIERYLPAQDEPLTQYRGFRRMHATSDRFNQEAWLEARTEFDQHGFRYTIVSERGSDYVRNRVLKPVLRREQELIATGGHARGALTAANYEFEDSATLGPGERYVLLRPKRKDVLLLDGRMVLSGDGSELLRVEGRLSKNPSFWTSIVDVIRHYARLDGVRVPISTESEARLKFAGVAHLDVHYEYETINGRPVSLSARATR